MESLRISGESPTRIIRRYLREYRNFLDDQDHVMILLAIRKIEAHCPYCKERCSEATDPDRQG